MWCWPVTSCRSILRFILLRKLCRFSRICCNLLLVSLLFFCLFLVLHKTEHSSQRSNKELMVPTLKSFQDTGKIAWKANIPTSTRLVNGRAPKQLKEERTEKEIEENDTTLVTPSDRLHIGVLPAIPGVGSLKLLQKVMLEHNKAPLIHNDNKFLPLDKEGLVLIVQVHKREKYLAQLLESLKLAKGIENVLLVISHDYYSVDMNRIVTTVDFCRVIQIFYPLSLQVVPTSFPGASKEDCPRDATMKDALRMNCTNALHPDSYRHYREAIVTAIKHHWWWKEYSFQTVHIIKLRNELCIATSLCLQQNYSVEIHPGVPPFSRAKEFREIQINTVFDQLQVTRNYSGYVLFLEEDHYVSPDFIAVAMKLIELKKKKCSDCDFINLGMYNKITSFSNRVNRGIWNAGKNNMGFGMNRNTWNLIRNCSKYFCSYDDYNWDWSLNHLGKACPLIGRDLKVLVIRTPRVFHIGTCGIHHHKSCNEQKEANVVRNMISRQSSKLFPTNLVFDLGTFPPLIHSKLKAYGGWGDIRDHELCMKMAEGKTVT